MAKDGTARGSNFKVNAGRKSKGLGEKIAAGNPGGRKLKVIDLPEGSNISNRNRKHLGTLMQRPFIGRPGCGLRKWDARSWLISISLKNMQCRFQDLCSAKKLYRNMDSYQNIRPQMLPVPVLLNRWLKTIRSRLTQFIIRFSKW